MEASLWAAGDTGEAGAVAATGAGSWPGTDIAEALRTVLGEHPHLPYLPELPARGPGAEMIGRGAAFLPDLPVELYAGRWRTAARPGRDLRRTMDFLDRDLDTLTGLAAGYRGPLKVQAAGPWTLAASVDLPLGGRLLRDHGAVRDLAGSLAEGLAAHVADVSARVPGATIVVQLDEPSLPAVLAGRVPTESGLHMLRAVEAVTAERTIASIVEHLRVPVIVHCCASDAPIAGLRRTGAAGVWLDVTTPPSRARLDEIGELIDGGGRLIAGVVDPLAADEVSSTRIADRMRRMWRDLGFAPDLLHRRVALAPTCGLAGASESRARAVTSACVEAGRRLTDVAVRVG